MKDEKSVVYVVDDDPSVLRSVERFLRSAGYQVRTFTSALDFLNFPHQDTPGCLVLDVKMPDLGGSNSRSIWPIERSPFPSFSSPATEPSP